MRQTYIVTYDISHPKRLRKVYKLMKGYGEHVLQLSGLSLRAYAPWPRRAARSAGRRSSRSRSGPGAARRRGTRGGQGRDVDFRARPPVRSSRATRGCGLITRDLGVRALGRRDHARERSRTAGSLKSRGKAGDAHWQRAIAPRVTRPVRFAGRSQSALYVFEIAVVLRDLDPRPRGRGHVEATRPPAAGTCSRWRSPSARTGPR